MRRCCLLLVWSLLTITLAPTHADEPALVERITRTTALRALGSADVLNLRTSDDAAVTFGVRADERVVKAVLHLRYSYSPALIEPLSQLQVLLNDQLIKVLELNRAGSARPQDVDIAIDPALIADTNRLAFHFVAHYQVQDESPAHPSLWAKVSGASEIELVSEPRALVSDLATLPEPFFDRRDQTRLTLPFVFSEQPSGATLQAAAVTASWFGKLAMWRGARFPARLNTLPGGHAVVFATNAQRPAFMEKMPPFTGPGLKIIGNPASKFAKLLLLVGRDEQDLKAAAVALTLASATLSGDSANVTDVASRATRPAYDAPNWVRTDRSMKFGELIDYPQQLQSGAQPGEPVRIKLRVPPDLFLGNGPGIPMEIKYRNTPPPSGGQSHLAVSANGVALESIRLRPDTRSILGAPRVADAIKVLVVPYALRARTELQFAFRFVGADLGDQPGQWQGAIDADSRIDFSGLPHYAVMPELAHFAALGFPYTKYADLSQTVVVLPLRPAPADIETMLALMGRMGESTGHPATGVRVASPDDVLDFQNVDILLIGPTPQQSLLTRWGTQLPVGVFGTVRRFGQAAIPGGTANRQQVTSSAPLAALIGFESPLTPGRSVVALTAVSSEDMVRVLDAMDDPATRDSMRGGAVLVRSGKVDSVPAGQTYVIGALPWWTALSVRSAEHPVLLAQFALLLVLVVGFGYWRVTEHLAARALAASRVARD